MNNVNMYRNGTPNGVKHNWKSIGDSTLSASCGTFGAPVRFGTNKNADEVLQKYAQSGKSTSESDPEMVTEASQVLRMC